MFNLFLLTSLDDYTCYKRAITALTDNGQRLHCKFMVDPLSKKDIWSYNMTNEILLDNLNVNKKYYLLIDNSPYLEALNDPSLVADSADIRKERDYGLRDVDLDIKIEITYKQTGLLTKIVSVFGAIIGVLVIALGVLAALFVRKRQRLEHMKIAHNLTSGPKSTATKSKKKIKRFKVSKSYAINSSNDKQGALGSPLLVTQT